MADSVIRNVEKIHRLSWLFKCNGEHYQYFGGINPLLFVKVGNEWIKVNNGMRERFEEFLGDDLPKL